MEEELGASAEADRATAAEPVVSALRDGVPNAMWMPPLSVNSLPRSAVNKACDLMNAQEARRTPYSTRKTWTAADLYGSKAFFALAHYIAQEEAL
jgi:hypothetical protein